MNNYKGMIHDPRIKNRSGEIYGDWKCLQYAGRNKNREPSWSCINLKTKEIKQFSSKQLPRLRAKAKKEAYLNETITVKMTRRQYNKLKQLSTR